MAKIKAEHLLPGMVAAADIRNMDGMLLLPAGCELTERHAQILRTWGIAEIAVEGPEDDGNDGDAQMVIEVSPDRLAQIKARFWQFDEQNPLQQEILRLLARRPNTPPLAK
jgi:hypothetical protein